MWHFEVIWDLRIIIDSQKVFPLGPDAAINFLFWPPEGEGESLGTPVLNTHFMLSLMTCSGTFNVQRVVSAFSSHCKKSVFSKMLSSSFKAFLVQFFPYPENLMNFNAFKSCCRETFESLTCAGDGSKHPALAIFDRPHPGLAPLLEDRHAAGPSIRCDSISVRLFPATGQHTPVAVRVHLEDGEDMSWTHLDSCQSLHDMCMCRIVCWDNFFVTLEWEKS